MNEEIFSRLDALASKLGVAGAHLWEVLVRQAYVDFIEVTVAMIVLPAIGYASYRAFGKYESDYKGGDVSEALAAGSLVLALGAALGSLIMLAVWIDSLGNLFNPEYYALQKVMEAFGNVQ